MVCRNPKKAVVLKKTDEAQGGKIQHLAWIGGPHRRAHGDEIKIEEIDAQAIPVNKFADRAVERVGFFQKSAGHAEKTQDLENKGVEARVQNVAALCKKLVQSHAVVFKTAWKMLDAERHFRRLGLDAEFLKEANQIGVCRMVENNESRVDRDFASVFLDRYRVRMSARSTLAFDERDIGMIAKLPRHAHAGDARADDADSLSHRGAD